MRNPIESWTWPQIVAARTFLFIATLLVGAWIQKNDAPLARTKAPRSYALQCVFRPQRAEEIVTDWNAAGVRHVARAGTLIDTFAFIPLYSTLLAVLCFAAARTLSPATGWHGVALALGWGGWGAGALDLLENIGSFAELDLGLYAAAPFTGTVFCAKWTTIGACLLFLVVRIVSKVRGWLQG